jgi:hypothetical protein
MSLSQTLNDIILAVAQLVERSTVVVIDIEWSLVRIQVVRLLIYLFSNDL